VRRNVRWRGSDTRSWGRSRIPGRRLFFFAQRPVGRACKRGRLEAVRDANNAPTQHRYFRKCGALPVVEMEVQSERGGGRVVRSFVTCDTR
jgi:hypothetical protein